MKRGHSHLRQHSTPFCSSNLEECPRFVDRQSLHAETLVAGSRALDEIDTGWRNIEKPGEKTNDGLVSSAIHWRRRNAHGPFLAEAGANSHSTGPRLNLDRNNTLSAAPRPTHEWGLPTSHHTAHSIGAPLLRLDRIACSIWQLCRR